LVDIEIYESAIKAKETELVMQMVTQDGALTKQRVAGGITSIMLAAYNGAWELVRWFVELGAVHGLTDAVLGGDAEMVESMMVASPDAINTYNADGFTPLHVAAYFGKDPIALTLISRGADVNARSRNELHNHPLEAAIAGSAGDEVIDTLITMGADPRADGDSPLHLAAMNGRAQVIRLLLAQGADPKSTSAEGKTAADYASEAGHSELVEILT
jgi:ankyrin repeat protein